MDAHVEIVNPAAARAANSLLQSSTESEHERNCVNVSHQLHDHAAGAKNSGARIRIEQARCAFVSRACAKIERANELTSTLKSDDPSAVKAALGELHTIAHGLSGTAGSFGYGRLSELAGMLEETILSGQHQYQRVLVLVVEISAEFISYIVDRRPDFAR